MAASSEQGAGVFETDAPAEYVGIVIYDRSHRLLMRLEVHEDAYSPDILLPLEEWARQHERIRVLD